MSDNWAVIETHYANVATGDTEADRALLSPDVITVMPGAEPMQGIEPFLGFEQAFHRGFPDGRMVVRSSIESGDTVVVLGVFTGTHSGPLAGAQGEIPATGRRLELPFADFFTLEDGRIARHETYFDQVVLLGQLGLMPEPAGA